MLVVCQRYAFKCSFNRLLSKVSLRQKTIITNLTERLTTEMNRFKYFNAHLAVEIQNYSFMSLSGHVTYTKYQFAFLESVFPWASKPETTLSYFVL